MARTGIHLDAMLRHLGGHGPLTLTTRILDGTFGPE